jgi:hypothetical protein
LRTLCPAVPGSFGRWSRPRRLRATSAPSTSSPASPATRIIVSIRTRGSRLRGNWFRRLVPRLWIRREPGFYLGLGSFCFRDPYWNRGRSGLGGIVIGRLKRGLRRLDLAGFRILFGALETIAHPLAHVWFVTQRDSTGNLRRREGTKAASLRWYDADVSGRWILAILFYGTPEARTLVLDFLKFRVASCDRAGESPAATHFNP